MLTDEVGIFVSRPLPLSRMPCLYIYPDGTRCPSAALESEDFCADHLPLTSEVDPPSELPSAYRLARRLGAAVLLALFLLQLIATLRRLFGW